MGDTLIRSRSAGPPSPASGRRKRSPAEYLMYAFLLVILLVGALAVYSKFAPSFKEVPNTVD